jgi:hypothetical protein
MMLIFSGDVRVLHRDGVEIRLAQDSDGVWVADLTGHDVHGMGPSAELAIEDAFLYRKKMEDDSEDIRVHSRPHLTLIDVSDYP